MCIRDRDNRPDSSPSSAALYQNVSPIWPAAAARCIVGWPSDLENALQRTLTVAVPSPPPLPLIPMWPRLPFDDPFVVTARDGTVFVCRLEVIEGEIRW